jgi:lysophospholipase L1-like esterase
MKTVGVWGDSITYGACDPEALGWVGRLRKLLDTNDYGSVYNFGVCGDTSEDLLERFSVEANSIEPNVIILAIGINDSKYPVGQSTNLVPFEKYRTNIEALLIQARKYTDKIFVVGAKQVDESRMKPGYSRFENKTIQTYNKFLKKFCEDERLTFLDVFDVLDIKTDLYEGLHPNAQGYDKLFKAIANSIITK